MHVHGIMITGTRRRLATASAYNFCAQRGAGRRTLVIVNHGADRILRDPESTAFVEDGVAWRSGTHSFPDGRSVEFLEALVPKAAPWGTLGDLRNLGLSRVPVGDVFVTWDDDDYRAASFLEVMETHRLRESADAVMLYRRVECSLTQDAAWVSSIRGGAINTLYAVRTSRPWQRYAPLDVFEDDPLKRATHAFSRVSVANAPPWTYVRFHHATNTSPFAASRALPGWRSLEPEEVDFVRRARAAYVGLP